MKKLLLFILVVFSFNAFSDENECIDLFKAKNYEQAMNVCYRLSRGFIENDKNEIIEIIDGDPEVHFILGYMFKFGLGAPRNDWASVYWYTKAADKGHLKAQFELGELYNGTDPYDSEFETDIPCDLGWAQHYLELACEGGASEACPDYERLLAL